MHIHTQCSLSARRCSRGSAPEVGQCIGLKTLGVRLTCNIMQITAVPSFEPISSQSAINDLYKFLPIDQIVYTKNVKAMFSMPVPVLYIYIVCCM